MKIDVITIFPEFFNPFVTTSIVKRAIDQKQVSIGLHQLRDYSFNKHKKIDDTPYGGGVGMLMQFPPFHQAIKALKKDQTHVVLLSPQGKVLTQQKAIELAQHEHVILLCGHYEGVDARLETMIDEEISIGDYVLTGGEIPAMTVMDAMIRLIPSVIHASSVQEDSLHHGWLKHPQYTKPDVYEGLAVPDVLLSGNHQNIEKWRKIESIRTTLNKRPDLIDTIKKTPDEEAILNQLKHQK